MNTTLNKIKSYNPCEYGWRKLLNYLGKTEADDEPLTFLTILESNGIQDATWSLRTCEDEREVRLFACDCAESVLHFFEDKHLDDDRPRRVIEVARKFANGVATQEQLRAARAAARAAAGAAARAAARAAAGDAVGAVAWAAAGAATRAAGAVEEKKQVEIFKKYFG